MINDIAGNSIKDIGERISNFEESLALHLLQINQMEKNRTTIVEQRLRDALKNAQIEVENENNLSINIDELVPFFVEQCTQNLLPVDSCFASYYLHLLIRDCRDGLESDVQYRGLTVLKIKQFLFAALSKYADPLDTTVSSMKICYNFKNIKELSLHFVKEKYGRDFDDKLSQLKTIILQHPESSSNKQLEEMFVKMQVFVITNYQIGDPKNHALLEQCRQCLNSILGKGDIQKYVLRKRNQRLQYLQKLGATAAGMLVFHNQGPEADKGNVRNIFVDLKMAIRNTEESLQEGFDRIIYLKEKAHKVMLELIEIDVQQKTIHCLRPPTQILELNKFVVLFEVFKRSIGQLRTSFKKTQYLMEVDEKKFGFVIEKIKDILKYRSAIETELIFPHFVHLSEIWNSLVLYLNHLFEINKIKDYLDDLLSKQMENKFTSLLEDLSDRRTYLRHHLKNVFEEINSSTAGKNSYVNMTNKPFIRDYCAVTMALTGGFLVPSQLEKKLCENVDMYFGYANMEYATFAERHFNDVLQILYTAILGSSDLLVLFGLDDEVIKQDFSLLQQTRAKTRTIDTQTEIILNEIVPKNQITTTWNIWNFHKQAIKLANIRKKQTHSTQSNLCYGLRNAQNHCDGKSDHASQD